MASGDRLPPSRSWRDVRLGTSLAPRFGDRLSEVARRTIRKLRKMRRLDKASPCAEWVPEPNGPASPGNPSWANLKNKRVFLMMVADNIR
jgi:hypothetical protein